MLVSGVSPRPRTTDELLDVRVLQRLERLDVRTRKLFAGKLLGERRSKKRGQSVEFDDYRTYVPGDDLRFIDWNVYARLDRLFLKLFLEEEDLAVHIALDASLSMDAGENPTKLLFAARLAAAISAIGLVNHNRVGITIFGLGGSQPMRRLPDLRGRRHLPQILNFLIDSAWSSRDSSSTRPEAIAGDFNNALRTIARLRVGKGVMLVLSDFLIQDGYESGLKGLAAAGGYDSFCLQILSPSEIEPERFAQSVTGDLRLTDAETGRAAEVTITAPLIKSYRKRLEQYCADLGAFCAARSMTHMLVRSDTDLETLVLDTLRRRGLLV